MKPNDYIKKYKLLEVKKFNHNDFVNDIKMDFMNLFEVTFDFSGKANILGFENTVRAIRQKWDSINAKTGGVIPDKLWNYFFASFVAPTRDAMFPREMAKRKADYEERKEHRESMKQMRDDMFDDANSFRQSFFEDFWKRAMAGLRGVVNISGSLITLGLEGDCTAQDVRDSYRELSMKHHPDKGGNVKKFREITEAKNIVLGSL